MKTRHMETPDKHKIKRAIRIEPDMFYSEAFNCLSKSAILTLMRCLQKRKWDIVKVNRKKQTVFRDEGFIFPYAEATGLKIAGVTQYLENPLQGSTVFRWKPAPQSGGSRHPDPVQSSRFL